MADADNRLKNLRERIETSGDIDEADREILREFDDRLTLLNSQYSTYRHAKLLRHTIIMAEQVGGLADALEDRAAAEDIVRWINRNYDNEETNQDYRVALKVFGRRTTDEGVGGDPDEPPTSLAWIPSGTSSNYDPAPRPSQMLDWHDDVLPMIRETMNARDAAAIALQFDAGLRGFEFKDLLVGDITDHRHGLQVTVDGKQGRRTVTLIPSVAYITEWLDEHPGEDDPSAPLWSKLNAPEKMSYQMVTKMFKDPARRAEIDKPVTLTNFRKSSASWHASKGMNQAVLEDRYGWIRGSKSAGRYISVFSKDASDAVAELHGLEVTKDDEDTIGKVVCPRCDEENKHEARFCVRCGQALTADAIEEFEKADQMMKESYAQTDPRDTETLGEIESVEDVLEHPKVKQAIADALAEIAE